MTDNDKLMKGLTFLVEELRERMNPNLANPNLVDKFERYAVEHFEQEASLLLADFFVSRGIRRFWTPLKLRILYGFRFNKIERRFTQG